MFMLKYKIDLFSFSDSVSNVHLTKKMWLGHEFTFEKKKKTWEASSFQIACLHKWGQPTKSLSVRLKSRTVWVGTTFELEPNLWLLKKEHSI